MKPVEQISKISPLPVVDLETENVPVDGWQFPLSSTCRKHLAEGDVCKTFYQTLKMKKDSEEIFQCPFGFTTIRFRAGETKIALTGFIPFPRRGGSQEKIVAKRHPAYKIDLESVKTLISQLRQARRNLMSIEEATVKNYSMALHEIRKLNRTIVQQAERICSRESPSDPEDAPRDILNIWKTAELMSRQFDVIELLANENLAQLPLKTVSEPYRIFDKCVRVFRNRGLNNRLSLSSTPGFSPRVQVCDKTFPIIPTVLIENAIKYSIKNSEIQIKIELVNGECLISVISESNRSHSLDESIFKRGVRVSGDRDGSGNGLYVAQLVAQQHNSLISVLSKRINLEVVSHTFSFSLRILNERRY